MRVLSYLVDPEVTTAILDHLGLPSTPPPIAPARGPPQAELRDGDLADPPIE
jgi:hypothetical protein